MAYEPKWLKDIRKTKGGPRLIAKYQRPKDPNAGERLPDFVHETGHEHFRLDVPKPRAYVKCVQVEGEHVWGATRDACLRCGLTKTRAMSNRRDPDDACVPVSWWYCNPRGYWGRFAAFGDRPELPVTEHEDGTISVEGVIGSYDGPDPTWRGTLTRGVWEEADGGSDG